jgi:hypothetical protein
MLSRWVSGSDDASESSFLRRLYAQLHRDRVAALPNPPWPNPPWADRDDLAHIASPNTSFSVPRHTLLALADDVLGFAHGDLLPETGRLVGLHAGSADLVDEQSAGGEGLVAQHLGREAARAPYSAVVAHPKSMEKRRVIAGSGPEFAARVATAKAAMDANWNRRIAGVREKSKAAAAKNAKAKARVEATRATFAGRSVLGPRLPAAGTKVKDDYFIQKSGDRGGGYYTFLKVNGQFHASHHKTLAEARS